MNDIQLKSQIDGFRGWLQSPAVQRELSDAVRENVKPITIARVVLSAMARSPKILECSKQSIWSSILQCLELGLLPDGREAALIPYNKQCTMVPMYQGLVKLCSNRNTVIHPPVNVYSNEHFSWQPGARPPVQHKPLPPRQRGDLVGAYAVAMVHGEPVADFMWRDDIDAIRKRSSSAQAAEKWGKQTPWDTDFDEMAKKTVFKRLAKYLPKSAEMLQALAADDEPDSWSIATAQEPLDSDFQLPPGESRTEAVARNAASKATHPAPQTTQPKAEESSGTDKTLEAQNLFLRLPPDAKTRIRENWKFQSSAELSSWNVTNVADLIVAMNDELKGQ